MISPDLSEAIKLHAIAEYPRECCGYVIGNSDYSLGISGTYVTCLNLASAPEVGFRIDPTTIPDNATAIVHSHPNGPNCPSEADMINQMNSSLPWIIVSTDGVNCLEPFAFGDMLPIPDLLNRPFMSGVTDCYDAIRHRLMEVDIHLEYMPREWGWWHRTNLYEDNLAKSGFRKLREDETIQPYDCFLVMLRSTVYNHGGVYLGDGLVYHHLGSDRDGHYSPTRLPIIEYGHRWLSLNPLLVRHELLDRKT